MWKEVRPVKLMGKRVLVNLPAGLYSDLRQVASRELRSISSLIRESILHRLEESLSPAEKTLIERGHREFREGKGRNWRNVRRG